MFMKPCAALHYPVLWLQEYKELATSNTKLRADIRGLSQLKSRLEKTLRNHEAECLRRLLPTVNDNEATSGDQPQRLPLPPAQSGRSRTKRGAPATSTIVRVASPQPVSVSSGVFLLQDQAYTSGNPNATRLNHVGVRHPSAMKQVGETTAALRTRTPLQQHTAHTTSVYSSLSPFASPSSAAAISQSQCRHRKHQAASHTAVKPEASAQPDPANVSHIPQLPVFQMSAWKPHPTLDARPRPASFGTLEDVVGREDSQSGSKEKARNHSDSALSHRGQLLASKLWRHGDDPVLSQQAQSSGGSLSVRPAVDVLSPRPRLPGSVTATVTSIGYTADVPRSMAQTRPNRHRGGQGAPGQLCSPQGDLTRQVPSFTAQCPVLPMEKSALDPQTWSNTLPPNPNTDHSAMTEEHTWATGSGVSFVFGNAYRDLLDPDYLQ